MIKFERNVNHDSDYRLRTNSFTIYFNSDNKWEKHWKYWPGIGFNIGGTIFVRWGKNHEESQCWNKDNLPFKRRRNQELTEEELILRNIFGDPDESLFYERAIELYNRIYKENDGLARWNDLTIAQQDYISAQYGKLYLEIVQIGESK